MGKKLSKQSLREMVLKILNETLHGMASGKEGQKLKGPGNLEYIIVKGQNLPSKPETQIESGEQLVQLFKQDLKLDVDNLELKDGEEGTLGDGQKVTLRYSNQPGKNSKSLTFVIAQDNNGKVYGFTRFFNGPTPGKWSLSDFMRDFGFEPIGGKAAKATVKIKPTDLVGDEQARSIEELRDQVIGRTQLFVKEGKSEKIILEHITLLFDAILSNGPSPVLKGAGPYAKAYQDYLGETLAPCSLMTGWLAKGARDESEKVLVKDVVRGASYKSCKIRFPTAQNAGLSDSELVLGSPNDPDVVIGISSKGGGKGANPSIANLYMLMQKGGISEKVRKQYERIFKLIEILSINDLVSGPLMVARDFYHIIDQNDYDFVANLFGRNSRTGKIPQKSTITFPEYQEMIKTKQIQPPSKNLQALYDSQQVKGGQENWPAYRFLTAIAKQVCKKANETEDFDHGVRAIFASTAFVQVYAHLKSIGDDAQFESFYTVYPPTLKAGRITLDSGKGYFPSGPPGTKISFSIGHKEI